MNLSVSKGLKSLLPKISKYTELKMAQNKNHQAHKTGKNENNKHKLLRIHYVLDPNDPLHVSLRISFPEHLYQPLVITINLRCLTLRKSFQLLGRFLLIVLHNFFYRMKSNYNFILWILAFFPLLVC